MRSVFASLVLSAGVLANLTAQSPPEITITGVSVESPIVLPSNTAVYVRANYRSDQPLRVQAASFVNGRQNKQGHTNPSPVYPAGTGEAVAWISHRRVINNPIDEIRVTAYDSSWKPLKTVAVPVHLSWDTKQTGPAPAVPTWAKEFCQIPKSAITEDMKRPVAKTPPPSEWTAVLLPLMFLSVTGYPLLQLYALIKLRRRRRIYGALPLIIMIPVYGYCLYALFKGSNLFPLTAIFLSPPAFLYIGVILLVFHFKPVQPLNSPSGG